MKSKFSFHTNYDSSTKEVDLAYNLPEVASVFQKNSTYFKQLYSSFLDFPADE